MDFVNRTRELAVLRQALDSDRAELVVVYGRRRVGKTELLRKASEGRDLVFFSADLSTEADQLRMLSERIARFTNDPALQGETFTRWESLLEYLFQISRQRPLCVVLDEFPYLCQSRKALPSMLQRLWDEHHDHCRLKLVLCGSTLSFMEKEVLGHKSPLYGRRTAQIELDPLPLAELVHFFPNRSLADRIRRYGVVGGIPMYLVQLDPTGELADDIRNRILSKGSYLYEEVRFLLMEELREPTRYFGFCRAVAEGRVCSQDIAQATGLDKQVLSKYLNVLRDLRVLEREVPVTETDPGGSRRGRYRFRDPFFRFWFRYVSSYRSFLDRGEVELVYQRFVAPTFDAFLEPVFTDVVASWLERLNLAGDLPFLVHRFGGWWLRERSLPLVGIDDEQRALVVGTRWSGDPVNAAALAQHAEQARAFGQHYTQRQLDIGYCSAPGFSTCARTFAASTGCLLWELVDIEERGWS
jgi:AAA+ ATPase superfamily predicted ATPase